MLNTYIKNRGTIKTIIHDNNENHVNLTNWDVDYDGDMANISVDSNTDGKRKRYSVSLDNQDLANILSMPSVNIPIHKRLQIDFQEPYYQPDPYFIELPATEKPRLEEMVDRRISSPSSGEELIIPLTIDRKARRSTPHKKHKRAKSHITHKVYKKSKTSRTKSKTTSRRKTIPVIELL